MTDAEALKVAIEACRFFGNFDEDREPASARAFYIKAKEAAAVLEAQANVEEKKAAFLEAARVFVEDGGLTFSTITGLPEVKGEHWKRVLKAYRAIVEFEKSASKKNRTI